MPGNKKKLIYRISFDFPDEDTAFEWFEDLVAAARQSYVEAENDLQPFDERPALLDAALMHKDSLHDNGKRITHFVVRRDTINNGRKAFRPGITA